MDRRLIRLEQRFARAERLASPAPADSPIDWRAVPAIYPECFAGLTDAERLEWGELTAQSHEPGAWQREHAFFRRLAELDNRIDWQAGMPALWMVR